MFCGRLKYHGPCFVLSRRVRVQKLQQNLLTFLGKSPNAVAAKYPELIEPEIKNKRNAITTSAITERILIQFNVAFIEFHANYSSL